MSEVFVQNIENDVTADDGPLGLPVWNFKRVNGQDYANQGGSDGRTPGDPTRPPKVGRIPVAGVTGRRNAGSQDWLDSHGDDGRDAGDPHVILHPPENAENVTVSRTVECPSCGYTFTASPSKPLGLPTMNVSMVHHGKKKVPVSQSPNGAGDDDQPNMAQCPRCDCTFPMGDEAR